jgi:hypothetical protein
MFGDYTVMPVLSSGQWAGTAQDSYASMETIDIMHLEQVGASLDIQVAWKHGLKA